MQSIIQMTIKHQLMKTQMLIPVTHNQKTLSQTSQNSFRSQMFMKSIPIAQLIHLPYITKKEKSRLESSLDESSPSDDDDDCDDGDRFPSNKNSQLYAFVRNDQTSKCLFCCTRLSLLLSLQHCNHHINKLSPLSNPFQTLLDNTFKRGRCCLLLDQFTYKKRKEKTMLLPPRHHWKNRCHYIR